MNYITFELYDFFSTRDMVNYLLIIKWIKLSNQPIVVTCIERLSNTAFLFFVMAQLTHLNPQTLERNNEFVSPYFIVKTSSKISALLTQIRKPINQRVALLPRGGPLIRQHFQITYTALFLSHTRKKLLRPRAADPHVYIYVPGQKDSSLSCVRSIGYTLFTRDKNLESILPFFATSGRARALRKIEKPFAEYTPGIKRRRRRRRWVPPTGRERESKYNTKPR